MEGFYEKINDYGAVTINLASPQTIRSWSWGEVKKPETINYRTYRSEKDGLFCERIFGPEKDYECFCGKYKGIKYKGIICDRCGVKVTTAKVRRKRMGHINLAAPVAHIWFFKAMPSRIGNLLALKTSDLERVIYYQDYIITDVKEGVDLKEKELLTEEQYRNFKARWGDGFEAGVGAEAVKRLLQKLELPSLADRLRTELKETRSQQLRKDKIKQLRTVEMVKDSPNDPSWMILDVVPVIPPDLRPLVLLDSGNFATSDLNDLYRRLINRNNRLKKLIDLNAPEVIIRNEKRMLQQSVDALFDNGRCRRPVLGSSNRPLKSLTDMIKGKGGRFRENLLGKRVDYSARSVIVVEPALKLHQCGLPKKIALELFQPFIIRRLKELGHADTIKSAKKMLERKDEEVWDILEDVIHRHPVLLNRAPTLHRIGIQAFEPVLVEGNAIKIHPLVCTGFNADFDGDQMAVHLPLSLEAQVEAHTLMMSTNNIFSPAHGNPIIAPSQDIVLGCYYLTATTIERNFDPKKTKRFADTLEALQAFSLGKIDKHQKVWVRFPEGAEVLTGSDKVDEGYFNPDGKPADAIKNKLYLTTPGRLLFNDILPEGMPFCNYALKKKDLNYVIATCHKRLGKQYTLKLLDALKQIGFKSATLGGISFSTADLRIPAEKEKIIGAAQAEVDEYAKRLQNGEITDQERSASVIDCWTKAREDVGKAMLRDLQQDHRDEMGHPVEPGQGKHYLNPVYMMADSGARGSVEQIRQLAGMRGLMAKPSGKIIETPIKSNFREGLRVLEYFSSTHGARKGLADTALKTADSGYLTRKLADVAQNVVINEHDCKTTHGVVKRVMNKGEKTEVPLSESVRGRTAREQIKDPRTNEILAREGDIITDDGAKKIEASGIERVKVRSALTCESPLGVCATCYGADMARGKVVELGMAVGIIAAQSIGEPGTQLTMRTFHIGGVASAGIKQNQQKAAQAGILKFDNLRVVMSDKGTMIAMSKRGELILRDTKDTKDLDRYEVPLGSVVLVEDGQKVKAAQVMCEWDPFMIPILSEAGGRIRFSDLVQGRTYKLVREQGSKKPIKLVIEHKGNLHPEIIVEDPKTNEVKAFYPIPEKAVLLVDEGQKINQGAMIAKTPREVTGAQDITGGLPRVTEIFEARRPKNPAVIARVSGTVEIAEEKRRGKRTLFIHPDSGGPPVDHVIPQGKQLRVNSGDYAKAGEAIVEGPLVPHDILDISGQEVLQEYLMNEVQKVYRSQNVTINDKHIEVIVAQMLRKQRVVDEGDTHFLPDQVVDKFKFRAENSKIIEEGGKPARARPLLLGITKASLSSDSFISAASFQETTKVLTEAALAGRSDQLLGLKENVILGHIIPAGTGYKAFYQSKVKHSSDDDEGEEAAPPPRRRARAAAAE